MLLCSRSLRGLWLVIAVFAAAVECAAAQFDAATVLGRVTDQIRRRCARRDSSRCVRIRRPASVATTVTNAMPKATIQFLNGSHWRLHDSRRSFDGFTKAVAPNVDRDGERPPARGSGACQVGGVGETVEVTSAPSSLLEIGLQRSRPGDQPRAGRQLAAQWPGSYADLALLSPGVRSSSISSSRDASFNVNGMRSALNNFIARRYRQQFLRHQQPGIFEPGRPGLAGCR